MPAAGGHALFGHPDPERPVFAGQVEVSQGQLMANAVRLVETLPPGDFLINLCTDRFHFCVALIASLVSGRCMLLPVSRHPTDLAAAVQQFGCSAVVADEDMQVGDTVNVRVDGLVDLTLTPHRANPVFADDQVLAMAFTSGSTGTPDAHAKLWGTLANTARCLAQRFGVDGSNAHVVATVPSQHMYGLEMTALLMLQGGVVLSRGHPFYPRDVVAQLAATPSSMLVTTPVHLRALHQARVKKPTLRHIVCATAPLSAELAAHSEREFGCVLEEIYGCTEAGSIATRRTVSDEGWQLLDGFSFAGTGVNPPVVVPYLPEPVALADEIEVHDNDFRLCGRNEDMLNVAGKRFSLAELNMAFQSLDGIADAIAVIPPGARHGRPAALVVSALSARSIARALAKQIDAAFIPRPIVNVDAIPRNATGKVAREAVDRLLAQHGKT